MLSFIATIRPTAMWTMPQNAPSLKEIEGGGGPSEWAEHARSFIATLSEEQQSWYVLTAAICP